MFFFSSLTPLVFRGTNQFHLWVAKPQALLPVKSVSSGHVHHAAIGQPHPASGHHVRRVHHGGAREPLRPGLGTWRLPGKARKLPPRQLPALCSWGMRLLMRHRICQDNPYKMIWDFYLLSSSLMCRLDHLSTTWPQTCSTTLSSCRRFSWRRSMRSFRRSQVLYQTPTRTFTYSRFLYAANLPHLQSVRRNLHTSVESVHISFSLLL